MKNNTEFSFLPFLLFFFSFFHLSTLLYAKKDSLLLNTARRKIVQSLFFQPFRPLYFVCTHMSYFIYICAHMREYNLRRRCRRLFLLVSSKLPERGKMLISFLALDIKHTTTTNSHTHCVLHSYAKLKKVAQARLLFSSAHIHIIMHCNAYEKGASIPSVCAVELKMDRKRNPWHCLYEIRKSNTLLKARH